MDLDHDGISTLKVQQSFFCNIERASLPLNNSRIFTSPGFFQMQGWLPVLSRNARAEANLNAFQRQERYSSILLFIFCEHAKL